MFWGLWQDAFPDCMCTINLAVAEGTEAIQESVVAGTYTETFHVPTVKPSPDRQEGGHPLYAEPHLP